MPNLVRWIVERVPWLVGHRNSLPTLEHQRKGIGRERPYPWAESPPAGVAQLEAQAICNRQVVGSSPTTGSLLDHR